MKLVDFTNSSQKEMYNSASTVYDLLSRFITDQKRFFVNYDPSLHMVVINCDKNIVEIVWGFGKPDTHVSRTEKHIHKYWNTCNGYIITN